MMGKEESNTATNAEHAIFTSAICSYTPQEQQGFQPPWKYVIAMMLLADRHFPGSSRSQSFAVGLQAITLLIMSINV